MRKKDGVNITDIATPETGYRKIYRKTRYKLTFVLPSQSQVFIIPSWCELDVAVTFLTTHAYTLTNNIV